MDKRKSILNISVSMAFKVTLTALAIMIRRLLIQTCGNEVNGLHSLYVSLLSMLSLAELGIGTAITFHMYKPIVEEDLQGVSALYRLYRRVYLVVGGIVLAGGLLLLPHLKHLAADYAQLNENLYTTFTLILLSVVIPYAYSAKAALFDAHKNNYVSTAISSGGNVLQDVLQIIVLTVTGSFEAFLVCRIVAALVMWVIVDMITAKAYPKILKTRAKLDRQTRCSVIKNVKAIFMHKLGGVLGYSLDSVVISAFIGVNALGEYTNYTVIWTSAIGIVNQGISSLTSTWGHLFAGEDPAKVRKHCEAMYLLNSMIGITMALGYFAIADNLVAILFGTGLEVERTLLAVITANGFVQFLRKNTLIFKDAAGLFYHDRWKPLVEGLINLGLSVLLVNRIGIMGVIVATVTTNLLINHITEPYVLYKFGFFTSPKGYYWKNYTLILLFVCALPVMEACRQALQSQWLELLVNGFISVGISGCLCCLLLLLHRDSWTFLKSMAHKP